MKICKVAIIGQGRSGRNIHGSYFRSEQNQHYQVVAVVERDADRRALALKEYPDCEVYDDYRALFDRKDLDLVVNASFSDEHYPITKELLEHGMPVLVEKPMARNYFEANTLIQTAKKNGAFLAVFQQTFLAPFFLGTKQILESGKLGDIKQVSIAYSGFSRRWDWQTLQNRMGGSVYNTGPHPLGLALAFLDFSDDLKVAYSKLDRVFTSGDAEDFAKIILVAPGKPVVDVEINSNDAFSDYKLKILGSKGSYKCGITDYKMKYIVDGENPAQPLLTEPLKNEEGNPMYCTEKLVTHEEEGRFDGTAFAAATATFYDRLYASLTEGAPLAVPNEHIAKLVNVIETVHAQNPMDVIYP